MTAPPNSSKTVATASHRNRPGNIAMANEEHLGILRQGVEAWNTWRRDNRDTRPDFRGANLRLHILPGADLRQVNLNGANLRQASLCGASLYQANLRGAVLRQANLRDADLRLSDLRGAVLLQADLCGADLRQADLRGAHLNRADLTGANLTGARLDRTVYSVDTRFPEAFDPTRHGMSLEQETPLPRSVREGT